jgi:hypothetical protein
MVKPELDVSIDYYSLLNVSHRADAEEIKKSYRKLGTIALFLHKTIANPLAQRWSTTPTGTWDANRLRWKSSS